MKRTLKKLVFAAATGAALQMMAMPIGLRTAVWGVSSSNGRTAVARLLPETGSAAEIEETLAGFNDKAVGANIADDSEYEEFREWALESGARVEALTNSPTAWLSFATGSPVLVAEPQEGDLVIDEVSAMDEDGKIEIVFSLEDVTIDRQALEARLKSIFGVVGSTTLDESEFSEANLALSLTPTEDGRVKATITPKKDAGGNAPTTFFMRVKVK